MSVNRHFKNSKREMWIILATWAAFCLWVIGYCAAFAYEVDEKNLVTVLGMPSWVVWGIALPWCVATTVTVVFGIWGMADRPLTGEGEDGTGEEAA